MAADGEGPSEKKSLLSDRVFRYPEDLDILNEAEGIYFQIFDMTPDEQRAVWGNNAWLQLNGMPLEALQKYSFRDYSQAVRDWQLNLYRKIQVDHLDDVSIKTIYPSAQGGNPITLKFTMRPMRLKFPDKESERVVIVSSGVAVEKDKDDFVRAQEMLRYTQVVQVILTHESLAIVYGNLKAELLYPHIFNSKDASAKQDGLRKIFDSCVWDSGELRHEAEEQIRRLTLQSASFEFECRKVSDGKTDIWHKFVFTPCTDPVSGKFSLSLCEYDVSDMKEEQNANKAKDDFLAVISHELRTPLNGIIGLSDALSGLPDCPTAMKPTLELICHSGHRLTGLVNDILDSASARQNRLRLILKELNVQECADHVCKVLSGGCKPNVKITNKIQGALPSIEADPARISQVLTNLVSNAVKFTPNGEVEVSASMDGDDFVRIEVKDSGIGIPESQIDKIWQAFQQVDMSSTRKFEGTGLGLSLVRSLVEAHGGSVHVTSVHGGSASGSVFSFRLPRKQQPGPRDGSGDRQTVELLRTSSPSFSRIPTSNTAGSESRVGSMVGSESVAGTSVEPERAEVGCQTEEAESRRAGAEARAQPGSHTAHVQGGGGGELDKRLISAAGPMRAVPGAGVVGWQRNSINHHSELHDGKLEIMSVDDNHLNHAVIEATFIPKGFVVTKCMGGKEVLELLSERGYLPDIMLLDVMMPEMDGYELCEQLRQTYPENTLPVIMLSAKDKTVDVLKGLESGCNDYVTKPFHNSELTARIGVQLKMRSLWYQEMRTLANTLVRPDGGPEESPDTEVDRGGLGSLNEAARAHQSQNRANSSGRSSRASPASNSASSLAASADTSPLATPSHGMPAVVPSTMVDQVTSMDATLSAVDYVLQKLPQSVQGKLPKGHVVVWIGAGGRTPSS